MMTTAALGALGVGGDSVAHPLGDGVTRLLARGPPTTAAIGRMDHSVEIKHGVHAAKHVVVPPAEIMVVEMSIKILEYSSKTLHFIIFSGVRGKPNVKRLLGGFEIFRNEHSTFICALLCRLKYFCFLLLEKPQCCILL